MGCTHSTPTPPSWVILKIVCILLILQSQVECWEPLFCFPWRSAVKCSSLRAFSQCCRAVLAFCVCFQAICKGSYSQSMQAYAESWPYECGWGMWNTGDAYGPVGGVYRQGIKSSLWMGFLMESAMWWVESAALWWVPSPSCCAPSFSQPLSHANHLSVLGWVKKK